MPAQTVAMPQRWPLVQQFYTRSSDIPITKDARLVNAFAEKDSENEYWVNKRVGISPTPQFTLPNGQAGGVYYYSSNNQVISVVGQDVYINSSFVGTVVNFVPPTVLTPQFFFETINSSPTQTVVIKNTSGAAILDPTAQTLTQITDPNFPDFTCPGWAYLDGTLYVMDFSGGIHGTLGFNDASVWDPLSLIFASSKGDLGVALFTQLTFVVAFKQWTTQIFYDAFNPTGSPLGQVPEAQIPYGCLHANSIQKIDEILFWISSNQTISPQVIMMENLAPKIISTPSIDRMLDNLQINILPGGPHRIGFPTVNDNTLYSFSFKHQGHRFYGITHTSLNFTLVYDIDQKLWYQWTDANGNYWPMSNCSYIAPTPTSKGLHIAQALPGTSLPGSIYLIDADTVFPNDMGVLFPVDIYTPNFTAGTDRRKVLNALYFTSDQTPGSQMQARYSDNDYKDWSNFRTVDLNDNKPFIDQEGTFTKRAYHLRHRCNTRFRIKTAGMQLDIGSL